jgi:hypothetical protein
MRNKKDSEDLKSLSLGITMITYILIGNMTPLVIIARPTPSNHLSWIPILGH